MYELLLKMLNMIMNNPASFVYELLLIQDINLSQFVHLLPICQDDT